MFARRNKRLLHANELMTVGESERQTEREGERGRERDEKGDLSSDVRTPEKTTSFEAKAMLVGKLHRAEMRDRVSSELARMPTTGIARRARRLQRRRDASCTCALAECRVPRWATKLPCCASVSSRCARAALRRGCHLYGNLEADKEKTREREGAAAKIGKKRLTGGGGGDRDGGRKGRRANLNLLSRGRVRAFLHDGVVVVVVVVVPLPDVEGSFL